MVMGAGGVMSAFLVGASLAPVTVKVTDWLAE